MPIESVFLDITISTIPVQLLDQAGWLRRINSTFCRPTRDKLAPAEVVSMTPLQTAQMAAVPNRRQNATGLMWTLGAFLCCLIGTGCNFAPRDRDSLVLNDRPRIWETSPRIESAWEKGNRVKPRRTPPGTARRVVGWSVAAFQCNQCNSDDDTTAQDHPEITNGHRSAESSTFSFKSDLHRFGSLLREDAHGLANWNNAAILGVALAGSLAIRPNLDDDVRENTVRHPKRWGDGTKAIGKLGEVQIQLPVLFALYGYSLKYQDEEMRELSGSLLSAFTLSGLSALVVKGIVNTDRPSEEWNGGQFGFPSYHATSSFSLAAVLDEYYGHRAGLPAYALAGLISWSRIDERDHDLSDVIFGAALGYVIGKSVAGTHLTGDGRVRLLPYLHPVDGSSGLMLDVAY